MQLQHIQQKIFEIRGQKVMLDFDLAELYDVKTKVLNQAVSRNANRFPEDFMFRLTQKEMPHLRSQIVTSSLEQIDSQKVAGQRFNTWGGRRTLPYTFTEHGVTMLASVLKSDRAIEMNIAIVRAFIGMRRLAVTYSDIIDKINELSNRIDGHDVQLNQIYEAIEHLLDEKADTKSWENRERIGFTKNSFTK